MKPTDILENIKLYNADCMEVMKTFKDKQFDLAIVDPPFGISITTSGRLKRYNTDNKTWDDAIPNKKYFDELFRVSKNQIIWGGNYFIEYLKNTKCFLIYDKKQPQDISFASCEMAWTSFESVAKTFYYSPMQIKNRIHSCEKPVQLYKWLLQNYAKEGDTILDTHFGSLSIGIACHDMKFDLTAIELDKGYYEQAKQRLINHQRQLTIF
jgi:site-specific DNA-methyltransferase (adenine-specific)